MVEEYTSNADRPWETLKTFDNIQEARSFLRKFCVGKPRGRTSADDTIGNYMNKDRMTFSFVQVRQIEEEPDVEARIARRID